MESSEKAWLEEYRRGNANAMGTLVEHYRRPLFGFIILSSLCLFLIGTAPAQESTEQSIESHTGSTAEESRPNRRTTTQRADEWRGIKNSLELVRHLRFL